MKKAALSLFTLNVFMLIAAIGVAISQDLEIFPAIKDALIFTNTFIGALFLLIATSVTVAVLMCGGNND